MSEAERFVMVEVDESYQPPWPGGRELPAGTQIEVIQTSGVSDHHGCIASINCEVGCFRVIGGAHDGQTFEATLSATWEGDTVPFHQAIWLRPWSRV